MERLTNKKLKIACDYFADFASKEETVKYRILAESAPKYEEIYRKLADYEDKQEQGLLVELPCGIGADVYIIPSEINFRLNLLHGHGEINRVYHQKVDRITIHEDGWYMEGDKEREYGTGRLFLDRFYKETWFLTRSEAEEALVRMKGE